MENNKLKLIHPKNILCFFIRHKIISVAVIAAIVGAIVALNIAFSKQPQAVTVVKSSLKDVLEISELSSLEYFYSSYTTVYEKKDGKNDKKKPKYHVAYDGTVRTGFDFNDLLIKEDKEKKIIYIEIPKIQVQSISIDENSLDFIYVKDKYKTETVVAEAIVECRNDLNKKAKGEDGANLRLISQENAIETVKGITEPLLDHLPDGYTVEYK